jgi:hypothetical protein
VDDRIDRRGNGRAPCGATSTTAAVLGRDEDRTEDLRARPLALPQGVRDLVLAGAVCLDNEQCPTCQGGECLCLRAGTGRRCLKNHEIRLVSKLANDVIHHRGEQQLPGCHERIARADDRQSL